MAEGIETRHARGCRSAAGARCNCTPSFRASVWSNREKKRIRKSFPSHALARAWLEDARPAVRKGTLRAPKPTTLDQAAEQWLAGARSGVVRTRSGTRYKPGAIRGYERNLRLRVLPRFGGFRVSDVQMRDLQDFADELLAEGKAASTISCTLMPLRAIYGRALARGDIAVNPTTGLQLPTVQRRAERFASPEEARKLIAAVPARDRALWATAIYAGLRRGEIKALRWENVDLATGRLHVEHGWDEAEGEIPPKSSQGRRRVPIAAVLRDHLLEHKLRASWTDGLVFGRTPSDPFAETGLRKRAKEAWKDAKLTPLTLHEGRHTAASMMIAAGVNAKALSTYMGHYSIVVTLDLYGHLMPGNEQEAAGLLDAYLERSDSAARRAQVAG